MNETTAPRVRIYPPVYLLLSALLMVGLDLVLPFGDVIPSGFRKLGAGLMVAGLALDIWAAGLFNRAGTSVRPLEPSSALVTRGPFRLTRNPMYLGMVVMLVGLGLVLGSVAPFAIVPAFVLLIEHRFIRREEAMLEGTFGAAYAEYKSKVRRWI
jgi:protein-S-isoprenylcysteine O-methyltransferase Ste14